MPKTTWARSVAERTQLGAVLWLAMEGGFNEHEIWKRWDPKEGQKGMSSRTTVDACRSGKRQMRKKTMPSAIQQISKGNRQKNWRGGRRDEKKDVSSLLNIDIGICSRLQMHKNGYPGNHKKRTRLRQTLSQYYGIKFSPKDMTPHPSTTAIDASGNTPGQTAKEPGGAIALREVEEEDSAALQQTLDAQEQLESVHQPQRDLSDGSRIGRKHKKKNVLLTKYAIAQTMKGQQIRQLRKRLRRYLRREHVQFAEDGSPLPTTTVLDAGDKIPEKTGKTPGDARTQGEVEESMELSNTGNINTPSADFADSTSDITSLLPKTANSTPPLSDSPNPVAVVRRVPGVRKQESTASEDCGNKTRERVLADSDAKNTTLNPITADLNTESTKDVKDREEDVDIYHDRHFNSMKDAMLTKRPVEATPESERITDAAPPSLARRGGRQALLIQSLQPTELHFEALDIEQPPVPALAHGLDRVLFNRGVYALQDDASKVYNFDPYLQKVMSVADFDFNALKQYKTSSEDEILSKVAREHNRRYLGSTSSMTSSLNHFHFLLSNWRPLNVSMLSAGFDPGNNQISTNFTMIQKAPSAIFLRYKNGVYAVDADKEYDDGNVLMLLGKSLEKLLTMPVSEFERYRKGDLRGVTEEERTAPESYHYSTQGDFLMRSQLDAHDPRLPGTGMFDLKTRAVLSIRMRSKEYQEMVGYQLKAQQGGYESYEREYYDMIRSTLLKYSLQARMGRMDGIFIAYHNVEEIFGFQYLNMAEIDRALHGQEDPCLGDQEFRYSIGLMNRIMNEATARFPEQSMRFHFETRPRPENKPSFMYVFAEPMSETEINTIQSSQKERIAEFEREIMGVDLDEAASLKAKSQAIAAAAAASRPSPSGDDEDASVAATATDKTTQDSGPDTSSKRPLLGFTLTVRSKVNDIYVERPEDLRPKQRWDMEFSLQEISPEKAHAVYAEVKHRRHLEFTKNQQFDDDETPSEDLLPRQRRKREYAAEFTALLRRLSVQGAKERARREKEMEGREKVVVGLPVAARAEPVGVAGAKTGSVVGDDASDVSEEDDSVATDEAEEVVPEPKIENVDEYMGWLYEDTKSRLPPSPLPSESSSEEIESTDDYMRWLYRKS
ncbi:hypothetical protein MBLNU457_g0680t2 [Dothideomycetes sp. NU457]